MKEYFSFKNIINPHFFLQRFFLYCIISKKNLQRFTQSIFQFLFLSLVLLACAAGAAAWWLSQPLTLSNPTVELEIEPGTAPRAVAQTAVAAGVQTDARLLYAWFRLSGKDRQIRAGNYEILPGTTPYSLLQKLVQGDESLVAITFVEGWTFRQMRAAIAKEATLKPDIAALTEAQIMAALGKPGVPAEGRFFPDTYTYAKGSSDLAVLRRALHAMDRRLEAAWARHRDNHLRLRAGLEALGMRFVVSEEARLPQLNSVWVPEGVDEAAARTRLLQEFGLEIGAGLGALAGKVWRIGLMGHSSRPANVALCLSALETVIKG